MLLKIVGFGLNFDPDIYEMLSFYDSAIFNVFINLRINVKAHNNKTRHVSLTNILFVKNIASIPDLRSYEHSECLNLTSDHQMAL